jgi:hypothetical protein
VMICVARRFAETLMKTRAIVVLSFPLLNSERLFRSHHKPRDGVTQSLAHAEGADCFENQRRSGLRLAS